MRYRAIVFASLIFVVLSFSLSCQSGHSPLLPGPDQASGVSSTPQSEISPGNPRHLWGYWHCEADLTDGTVTVLPDRTADLHINATKPISNALSLGITIDPSSTPPTGYFVINVSITHPFPGNLQFTGFDVRGIFITSGSDNAGGLRIAGQNDPRLVNPDGWSRWWNPSEFTDPGLFGYYQGLYAHPDPSTPGYAMVNPYKLFADALSPTSDLEFIKAFPLNDQNGRAAFRSGHTNTRQYQIQFPVDGVPKVYFDYAIDASWALPTPVPPVNIPADFPIWANSMEAFDVIPTVESCTLAGTQFGIGGSGELVLTVEVWDWQGWNNGNYDNQIGGVRLYSPLVDFDLPAVERVDGLHNTVLTVTATGIPSMLGQVPVLIEIPQPGTLWKQSNQSAPSGEMASYAIVTVEILEMTCQSDDNVSCEDAEPVELQSTLSGVVCMPYDSTDYYVFTVPTGDVMEGTIELDNFDYADNDLILYDGCPGDPIDMSLTPYGATEVLNVGNIESGFYYIAVLPGETAGTDVQPYQLTLDITKPQTECTVDNNNEYPEAVAVNLQDEITESVCAGGDLRDWYKFVVPVDQVAGGTIYVDNDDKGDIEIRIYDVYPGPATFWGNNPGTQDEMVNISAIGPGTHYIELFAMGSTPAGDRGYNMSIDLITSAYSCDSVDGNNSPVTADPVIFTDIVTGTVCYPGDYDWFIFTVANDTVVHGTITLSGNSVADNDIYIYSDPSEMPIEFSAQVGITDETVTLSQLDPGDYYIKAAAHPNMGLGDQPYTLTLDLHAEETGMLDFLIHAHIICKDDGTSPATSESKVQEDIDWANEFYGQYGGGIALAEISYINKTSWLAATSNEVNTCHSLHRDKSGPINVYYVNSFPDMSGAAAYCRMDCRPAYQTHNSTYIAMCDYADDVVLAHELGHATGIFHDVYLLDYGFSSCYQINQYYCPPGSNLSYCNSHDKDYGNLMYFQISNWDDPDDYWLSDYHMNQPALPIESQAENLVYFHTNYPYNF